VDRRTLLRAMGALGVATATGAFTACAPSRREEEDMTQDSPRDSASPTTPAGTPTGPERVLVAYFSRPGENYYYGGRIDLEIGNTQVVAEMIAAAATVGVYRIEAADPYPEDYEETVARNVREQDADARPEIAGDLPDLSGYSTVLLGSPIWNVREPMIMRTFIESVDLAGRTIHPFLTFAVSGMGQVERNYTELLPEASIGEGLAVQGEEAAEARPDVEAWLGRIGLLA